MLGVLNRVAREAIESDGDLEVLGEGFSIRSSKSVRNVSILAVSRQ